MKRVTINSVLQSDVAFTVALTAALAAQLPHAASVFTMIVHGEGWQATLNAYGYAVALEAAILLFACNGMNAVSYVFAGISVATNLSFYYLSGVSLFAIPAIPAWLTSIALPLAIAAYSHRLAGQSAKQDAHHGESGAVARDQQAQQATSATIATETSGNAVDVQPERRNEKLATKRNGATQRDSTMQPDSATQSPYATERLATVMDATVATGSATDDPIVVIPLRERALQLNSEGLGPAEIARQLNTKDATVRSWLRRAQPTNGVAMA